jgi:signal transduction histidine kinase
VVKRLFGGKTGADERERVPIAAPSLPVAPERPENLSFDELRTGFTAAVSHELRTPLARILALLDSAELDGADVPSLIEQARAEVVHAGALIDEILFLSELESGREIVALGRTPALPQLEQVVAAYGQSAARAGVTLRVEGDPALEVPLRPRMLKIVAENLTENAIRYAGHGATFTLSVAAEPGRTVVTAADDGIGVNPGEVGRLFERFWRADSARASRGTGLGLAIVKHVVVAAGGTVDARSARGDGVEVRCVFPELELRDPERARVEGEAGPEAVVALDDEPAAVQP